MTALLGAEGTAQRQLLPDPRRLIGLGQRHITNPARRRRRLAAADLEHLREPLALDVHRILHRLLRAKPLRIKTLSAQYIVRYRQVAASQQADIQGKIQARDEAAALITYIQQQYLDFGVGRWACIEKSTNKFMGWCGIKFVTESENNQSHFHDIGYRFLPEFWHQGYAKEAAKPCVEYGFNSLNLSKIIGTCHINNIASQKVLQHCGLIETDQFYWNNLPCRWMEISKPNS